MECIGRPLHWAADKGQQEVIEVLLAAGASTEAEDVYGNKPREIAQRAGFVGLAEIL